MVVTRSEADNRRLAQILSELGAAVISIPLVAVLGPEDGGRALAAAVGNLTDYRWVVLTSVNGVEAVRSAMAGTPWPPQVMVAPVGPVTATAARSAGMRVGPIPETATAAALVEAFAPARLDPTGDGDDGGGRPRVLAPLAELAGTTVVDGLRAKGYRVDRVTAYRTAAPTDHTGGTPGTGPSGVIPAEAGRDSVVDADAVTFFAPSAVDRFVERFGVDGVPPTVVCVGPSTAERAAAHGLGGVITAAPHTQPGVVDALRAALTADG